jgi:3D (Asp-Asp-Asp) domain-containing protein
MVSVLQGLLGLTGLTCSALLTLGLITGPTVSPAQPEPPTHAAVIDLPNRAVTQSALPAPAVETPRVTLVSHETIVPARPNPQPAPTPTARRSAPRDRQDGVVYRVCRVTAYCDRGTTASGVQSGVGQCAAPGDIPFGAEVYIPALNQRFTVTDRTHRRFRRSTVDIFMPNRQQCLDFGCNYLEVEIRLPR